MERTESEAIFVFGGADKPACTSSTEFAPVALTATNPVSLYVVGVRCSLMIQCGQTSSFAFVEMKDVTVWINDPTIPVPTVTGGTLATGGEKQGTQTLTFGAVDNVGIREASVIVDGTQRSTVVFACDQTQLRPCNDVASGSLSLDTTALPNGAHEWQLQVVDAAGNAHRTPPQAVTFANPDTQYPTSIQYGGIDHSINTHDEATALIRDIEAASVVTGDRLWVGVSPADRAYIASQELSTEAQQMCREAFHDYADGYESFCKHEDLLWEDDDPTASGSSPDNPYGELNPAEKAFCRTSPFQCRDFAKDAARALRDAEKLFVGLIRRSDGTMANAFLHSYWTALMTNSVGGTSLQGWKFAEAHENRMWDRPSNDVRRRQSRMDMINNQVGYWWSNMHGTDDRAACRGIFERVRTGTRFDSDVDPFSEYERRGFDDDLGTWGPNSEIIWRRVRTRPAPAIVVTPFADGAAAC